MVSFLDAAETILSDHANQQPLTAREITAKALELGLIRTRGRTPDQTMSARIYVDIRDRAQQGKPARFVKCGQGEFGLAAWSPRDGIQPASLGEPATERVPTVSTLSFTDAAAKILEDHGERQPMHYREITTLAIERGLLTTQGKTPEATMSAQILTEIDRFNRRGEQPRFAKHGKGFVGLTRWMGTGLAFQIQQHNRQVRKRLLQRVRGMDPAAFEDLVGLLLTALGFDEVTVTAASGDGGIDVRGTLVVGDVIRTRMAVQVKRWSGNVQAPIVQQVRGSLSEHEQGLIITTSAFSRGAVDEAQRPGARPVGLMNGEQLVNLLVEYNIGVHRSSHDIIELGEDEGDVD